MSAALKNHLHSSLDANGGETLDIKGLQVPGKQQFAQESAMQC